MQEIINKILDYQTKIDTLKVEVTDEFNKCNDGAKERTHKLETRDGTVTEDVLWYEVQNLGEKCEAGEYLKNLYPKVFEISKTYLDLVQERDDFVLKELNMNPVQLSFGDIVRLIQMLK